MYLIGQLLLYLVVSLSGNIYNMSQSVDGMREAIYNMSQSVDGMREAIYNMSQSVDGMREAIYIFFLCSRLCDNFCGFYKDVQLFKLD